MKKFMRSTLLVVTFLLASMSASAGPVVEFYNVNLDHYFITSDANEAQAIDGGSAGPGWVRTSNSFNSGGTSAVCRFYGSQNPGPNSHFYTVDGAECLGLKQLQASTPATQKRWNFESLDFSSTLPTNGTCPTSTTPVYRAYNNGFARGVDSNHRISSNQAAIQEVVNRGWIYEGVVMCAPASGITAPTAVTIGYSQGDLSLTDPGLQKMTASLATTSGALLQAIYAVNSFVFTDPKVTDYATYVQRQADANQALDILILYAGQTEQNADALPTSAPSTLALLSPQGAPTSFKAAASPEEVLAVLNSSKSKWPIKTLMQQYQVSAKKAQLILNNAMNGLTSQAYLDQATVDTQVITRLALVKEASGLVVTVGSTFITAGAAGGVLTVFEAGTAIIGSTDAVIKVTKAGAELAIGQDGALDEMFEKSTMVRVIADVNEIVNVKSLFDKSKNLLDTTNKLTYVAGKLNEVFQEKKVSFGAESMTLTSLDDDFKAAYMARAKALQCPSTFPGNYVDAANQPLTVNAAAMPKAALDVLDALPVDAQLAIVQLILFEIKGTDAAPVTLSGTFPSTSLNIWSASDGKPLIAASNSGTWSMTGAGLELDHVEQYRDPTGVLLSYIVFVHATYGAQGTLTVTNNATWTLSPKELWLSDSRYVLSYRLALQPIDEWNFFTDGNVIASASINGLTAKVDYVFPKEGLGPFNRFTIGPKVRASFDADIYNKDGSFLGTFEDGHDYFRLLQVVVTGR